MNFYRDVTSVSGAVAADKVREILNGHVRHEEVYKDSGVFKPLEVWGRKGYNTERICRLSKPEDKMEDPVLGTLYRLRMLERGTRGGHGFERTSQTVCTVPVSSYPQADRVATGGRPLLAIQDGHTNDTHLSTPSDDSGSNDSDSSDSSSSSDTSSSSNSRDKGNKRKRSKGKKGHKKSKKSKKSKKTSKKSKKDNKHKKGDKRGPVQDKREAPGNKMRHRNVPTSLTHLCSFAADCRYRHSPSVHTLSSCSLLPLLAPR